jgi:hypothetical protein
MLQKRTEVYRPSGCVSVSRIFGLQDRLRPLLVDLAFAPLGSAARTSFGEQAIIGSNATTPGRAVWVK